MEFGQFFELPFKMWLGIEMTKPDGSVLSWAGLYCPLNQITSGDGPIQAGDLLFFGCYKLIEFGVFSSVYRLGEYSDWLRPGQQQFFLVATMRTNDARLCNNSKNSS